MNSPIDNIVIYNGYPVSVVIAVSFHCLLLALLLYLQSNRAPEAMEIVQPTIIKALFIDENPQVVNQQNAERQRLERVEQQRVAREQEQRRVEQERVEAEQRAAEERAQQQEREQAALVERQQLERQQAEKLRQEQEQEKRAAEEQQRQRELAEAERVRQQRQAAEQQRQQEVAQAAQAEAARTEYELVQSATALIQKVVQENWSRPPSARNGMSVVMQIRMLPTGELVDATITQSSGDPAFDRSAETAVFRAAPFRELVSLPINVFNTNFRTLTLTFRPEDLLN